MSEVVAAFLGAIIGSVAGPIIIAEYQRWRRLKDWRRPRKELLREVLSQDFATWYSIDLLSRVCGITAEECRDLLVDSGARGSTKPDAEQEMWALTSRAPLKDAINQDARE